MSTSLAYHHKELSDFNIRRMIFLEALLLSALSAMSGVVRVVAVAECAFTNFAHDRYKELYAEQKK